MKLAGLVFLGLIASFAFSLLLGLAASMFLPHIESDDTYLWIPVLITMPIGFFLGGIVTGYFSYYEIENKWNLVWLSPVLYIALLWTCVAIVGFLLDTFISGIKTPRYTGFLGGLWVPVLLGLFWYLASLAGVGLGYFLRERIVRWWYSD